MNLDELQSVRDRERQSDSLQQLRDSFYGDVAAYIQDLKASRDRRAEQVDDPFSDNEVRQLSDELDTAKEVAEAVYERRVGKVVKLASFAAADMPVDDEGMTTEERELFDDLVARISQNKQTVLDVLSGNGESAETSQTNTPTDSQPTAPTPPTERAAESEATEPGATEPSDSMLADAMGSTEDTEPSTDAEPPIESTAQPEPPAESEPAADHAPPIESTETSADEVPAPEAESETDVVLGTSTDGGTATDTANQSATSTASEAAAEAPKAVAGTTAEATESGADTTDAMGSAGDDSDRTTLRITKDVGEIFGVDGREYTLRSEDVVTLPTANADPLVDRDAAMRLE